MEGVPPTYRSDRVGGIEVELGLGRGPGVASRRGSGREAEVIEDLLCDRIVFDDSDRAHRALAARADEDVDREGPLEELRPVETARARRIIRSFGNSLEFLFRNETIDPKYKATRYQLLMLVRHQVHGANQMPALGANKMESYCDAILAVLWDDVRAASAFLAATAVVDRACNGNLDPDNVRTQTFTEELLRAQ
jgi:hypothetical protein